MASDSQFYDGYTRRIAAPWWLYWLLGLNLILLAVCIILMPELLAYLVAGFLLFDGLLFIIIGWQLRRLIRFYDRWRGQSLTP